jgi:cellulose synthase/poly-beta-1,6-N-acetylglucosamine synthase-like glycosyltransferase
MSVVASVVFWSCVVAIGFVYVGYPGVLAFVGIFINRGARKNDCEPSVSIVIAAHNEEAVIGATLANKLALDYPVGKREIIVVSDASTDRTEEIASMYCGAGVRLIIQRERAGKTAALNVAANAAGGEILVFSDANSMYRADTLRKLVRSFADPRVGYVTGRME